MVDNKCGDMPGHDKHSHSAPQQKHTTKIGLTQVLRRKKQGRSAEYGGEVAGDNQHQYNPEQEEQLVLTEMEQEQLHREETEYTSEYLAYPFLHTVIKLRENFNTDAGIWIFLA